MGKIKLNLNELEKLIELHQLHKDSISCIEIEQNADTGIGLSTDVRMMNSENIVFVEEDITDVGCW